METIDQRPRQSGDASLETKIEPTKLAGASLSDKEKEFCSFLAPAQAPDEIGRLGPYRVLKVLGAGGMGVVFRAEDPQLQRLVAIKAMLPALAANDSARQRFIREARAAAQLKHDHIVTIHQVGEDRGAPFLAMEFLEGESLEDRIKREGKLPLAEVLRIGREIADGLAAAHEHGLIHRDIKPGNVWLEGKRGRAKILDFGLARTNAEDVHLTQSGAIVGTPAYMPPEQARGDTVDARCDLYSLGCVLYRLCTGQLPFKGDNTMSLLLALATEQPKSVSELNADVPPALADLIMRLLAKDPAQRPATAGEVTEALSTIEVKKPAVVAVVPAPASPRRRRRLAVAVAAGALLLAVLLAVIVIVRNKQGDEIARVHVPAGGSVVVKDNEEDKKSSSRQGAHDDPDAAKVSPPVQIPEPPPLTEWLKGRTILTVSQDGKGQFKTIQAALDALKPHQVVKVLDRGPYREILRASKLPEDTGLISEQQTVLELPPWQVLASGWSLGHAFAPLGSFRLSGLRLLAPPLKGGGEIMSWQRTSEVVMEDCHFRCASPTAAIPEFTLSFDDRNPNPKPVFVRNCLFDTVSLSLSGWSGRAPSLVVERNYFKGGVFGGNVNAKTGQGIHKLLIRQNVFDFPRSGIYFLQVKETPKIIEISNNTAVLAAHRPILAFDRAAPKQGISVRNNISEAALILEREASTVRAEAIQNWQVDHNCYTGLRSLPKSPSDVLAVPEFLSLDPTHPDYLHIPADSPQAKGGAGGAWPSYIGAFPPGPAPKDGDWFTRLRQRWGDMASAYKPLSAPVQIAEPPPLTEWLKGRTILTVSQDGKGQFQTIQAALDVLKPHEVVKVLDRGPYFERLEVHDLPEDTGLVSDVQTVLELRELPRSAEKFLGLDQYLGHVWMGAGGFRLSGFHLIFPSVDALAKPEGGPTGGGLFVNQGGFVLENCRVQAKHNIGSWDSVFFNLYTKERSYKLFCVRECWIEGGLRISSSGNKDVSVLVYHNYFQDSCKNRPLMKLYEDAGYQQAVIRQNIFEGPGANYNLGIGNVRAVGALEVSNNTMSSGWCPLFVGEHFPRGAVAIQNNLSIKPGFLVFDGPERHPAGGSGSCLERGPQLLPASAARGGNSRRLPAGARRHCRSGGVPLPGSGTPQFLARCCR